MEEIARAIDRRLCVQRVCVYATAALIFPLVFYVVSVTHGRLPFDYFKTPVAVDFTAHYTAGEIALSGDLSRLYDPVYQRQVQQAFLGPGNPEFLDLYLSPPFVAYLYAPFAALPYVLAATLWTVISLALFIGALALLWPLVPALHRYGFRLFLLLALATGATFELFADGQDSALALFLIIAGVRLLSARRDLSAGMVLGLGVFKPQLFLLFPLMLLWQRRWRALAGYLAVALVLGAVSFSLVGASGVHSYAALLSSKVYHDSIIRYGWKMITLGALLHKLLPASTAFALSAALTIAEAGLLVLVLRARRDNSAPEWTHLYPVAAVVLITTLLDPHMFLYDGILLLLPGAVLFSLARTNRAVRFALVALYVIVWSTTLRGAFLGHLAFPLNLAAVPWEFIPLAVLLAALARWPESKPVRVLAPERPGIRAVLVGD